MNIALKPQPIRRPVVLTLESRGKKIRRVWDGVKPLTLGHATRWLVENRPEGVRIRELKDPEDEARSFTFLHEALNEGVALMISDFSLTLKSASVLPAAYAEQAEPDGDSETVLRFYQRIHGWTFASGDIDGTYVAENRGVPLFTVAKLEDQYRILVGPAPLRVATDSAVHELSAGQALLVTRHELTRLRIHSDTYEWTFNAPRKGTPLAAGLTTTVPDPSLRQGVAISSAALSALLLACLFWPSSPQAPLAPVAEPVTITLEKPLRKMKVAAMPSGASSSKKAQTKTAKSDVAPAFQGDRLQSAMKGLFRGGMTRLLAKSEFAGSPDGAESARKLFNGGSQALHSTAPVTGPGVGKGVRIAALGGGEANGGGKGVGYGHGDHANVTGQGKSLVAMDTSGSSVEEGLTKDEVGEVIHRHMSEVRYCYESSMLSAPDLEGKLVMGFTINATGKVKTAAVRNSTLTDSKLDDCILRRLSAWKFPRTKGGIDVAVTYPFIFKTLGG